MTWGEDSLNGLAATALELHKMITADTVKGALKKLGDGSECYKTMVLVMKDQYQQSISIFASAAVNALGGSTSPEGILARQSGSILNPNMELLFGGVQLRSFSFDFDFAPRDPRESMKLKKLFVPLK